MSQKNQKYIKPSFKSPTKGKQPAPKAKVVTKQEYPVWLNYAILGAVLLITFICYHFTLSNEFTNWDDGVYLYENSFVKNLSPANLNMLLFHDVTQNYYHPITMFSLALNYHYWGTNPQDYYIVEILIHLLNTALVFILSYQLFKAMVNKGYGNIKYIPYLAGLCALWQGIHPMHVESVSWLAERKDVLYLFFYLAGLIFYVKYVNGEKIPWMKYANIIPIFLFLWAASIVKSYSVEWTVFSSSFHVSEQLILYVLALIFAAVSFVAFRYKNINVEIFYVGEMFLFSLTSKPLAVVFPLTLFTIDILLKRKIEIKLLLEKTPLFILSLIFGYIAYVWAKQGGSISSFHVFTVFQRISFTGYNYLMYLVKLFIPTHLCSFYPYPEYLEGTTNLPMYIYFMPLAAIAITGGLIFLAWKKGENYFRITVFGFFFYFFNVMFILQFVSAGPAIMADRYSYASYFGFMFMLVYFIYMLWDKVPSFKVPVAIMVIFFSGMWAYLCQARTLVWHNTKTLWQDVIKKYPASADTVYNPVTKQAVVHTHQGVETAYKNLGNYYVQNLNPPNYDSAYMNYEMLERINTKDAGVYTNLGNIWAIRGNIQKSEEEYTKSLKIDSSSFNTYLNRGITYSKLGKNDLAIADFNHAYRLDSTNQSLYENRALTYLNGTKNYTGAIADYNRLIAIDPNNPQYFKYRGASKLNMGMVKESIDDFNKALNLSPKDGETMYDLSLAYKIEKSYDEAITYAEKAQQNKFKLPDNYLEELQKAAK